MKTFKQLSEAQQQLAVNRRVIEIVEGLTQGHIILTDPTMHEKFMRACEKANKMKTPWFSASYVMDELGIEITDMARREVEHYVFVSPNDPVFVPEPQVE